MTVPRPDLAAIHAEMNRARPEFHDLVANSSPNDLARLSNGTRWTNRELLFHMLLGYLVTRNVLALVKTVSRLPASTQRGFAAMLDGATRPFGQVNYWGSRAGGRMSAHAECSDGSTESCRRCTGTCNTRAARRSNAVWPFPPIGTRTSPTR